MPSRRALGGQGQVLRLYYALRERWLHSFRRQRHVPPPDTGQSHHGIRHRRRNRRRRHLPYAHAYLTGEFAQ